MLDRLIHLLVGLVLITALALSGCATRKPQATRPTKSEPITRADSTGRPPAGVVVQPARTLLDKLTGRTPTAHTYPPGTPVTTGKKATVTIYNAPATFTTTTVGKKGTGVAGEGATATVIEKAKAPVTTGTGDATDQAGAGVASTIKGNNNAPQLTNAPVEAPDWKAQLAAGFANPVGKVVALVLLAGLVYGGYRLWPVLRRKSSTSNQA